MIGSITRAACTLMVLAAVGASADDFDTTEREAQSRAESCLPGCARTATIERSSRPVAGGTREIEARTEVIRRESSQVKGASSSVQNKLADLGAVTSKKEIRIVLNNLVLF